MITRWGCSRPRVYHDQCELDILVRRASNHRWSALTRCLPYVVDTDESCLASLRGRLRQVERLAAAVRRHNVGIAKESAKKNQLERAGGSCFKWTDGILVEALQRGDWIVFESANLCSARLVSVYACVLKPVG